MCTGRGKRGIIPDEAKTVLGTSKDIHNNLLWRNLYSDSGHECRRDDSARRTHADDFLPTTADHGEVLREVRRHDADRSIRFVLTASSSAFVMMVFGVSVSGGRRGRRGHVRGGVGRQILCYGLLQCNGYNNVHGRKEKPIQLLSVRKKGFARLAHIYSQYSG